MATTAATIGRQDDNRLSASPRENGWLELGSTRPAARQTSDAENSQRERFADGLRAVLDVQLAQYFLHVILHRQRADPQNGPDLDVALAQVDPFQDFLFPRGKQTGPRRTCA